MKSWRLAFRNVGRNTRRSVVTILAIALAFAGMMLLGGYISWAHLAADVYCVMLSGHLQIFQKDFLEKGFGNPAQHAIANYGEIRQLLLGDEVLRSKVDVVTGQLMVQGIATCASKNTSATFAGVGAFPQDVERILRWNPYGLSMARDIPANQHLFAAKPELDADDPEAITIGAGIARLLEVQSADLSAAVRPTLELTVLPAGGGLPNMVSASVRAISIRTMEEIDNHLVVMPIAMANELLFPGEALHVTSVQLLLHRSEDLPVVEQRINSLIREHHLALEYRSGWDLNPNYQRSMVMTDMFFDFVLGIVSVVLVFTIYNTMMMGIVERTREIGAMRAMGCTRGNITAMFTREGIILGIIGGITGLLLGSLIAWCINHSMILYSPPYVNVKARLEVVCFKSPNFVILSFLSCFLVALGGAFFPARRAGRMKIAEALRH